MGEAVSIDEIGELTPVIQVKLLRVMQDRRFSAVGRTEEKSVDVKIISTTNRDFEQEIINGNFREDLYFRMNVINISVPPLRLLRYKMENFGIKSHNVYNIDSHE